MRDNINKPIAINLETNEVYILNSIFEHFDGLKGATGGVLSPVTQEYIDYRNDLETIMEEFDDCYVEAVANGERGSAEDFFSSWVGECDGEFFGHDYSYCHHDGVEKLLERFDNAVCFECIGGGRCFTPEMFDNPNIEILDQELVDLVIKYETN